MSKLESGISLLIRGSKAAACLSFAVILLVLVLRAGDARNPFNGNPRAAKFGESQFRINCAFCHGLSARGGGRGPDLTLARKRHGNSDADLFRTISNGIAGTAMPPNGTTGQGVGMTDEEIWQVITYLRSVEVKVPPRPIGDAAHGKALFDGESGCAACHMVRGKGGRLGPDLTATGTSRSIDSIIDSVRHPSRRLSHGLIESTKEFPQEYETVTVVARDGKEIKGVTLNEDHFSLQMMDISENIHLFQKSDLRSIQKSRDSLMPSYDATALNDRNLRDIVAYLLSVSEK